jgi:alkylation response protein AidB-like acyl-CoA dehydrogenase
MQMHHRFCGVSLARRRPTAKRLLADIEVMAPQIAARAGEIEAGRRMPPGLVETLRSIGVFRIVAPESHDGLELNLPEAIAIIEALGRIDGSVGWTVMVASVADLFMPMLPRQTYDRIYRNGPDTILAGSTQPAGTAERTADGWRVNGRWPFASGCPHADWLVGLCVITEEGKPIPAPTGDGPVIRAVALPAHAWQIEDTWRAAGLRGTGSHHIVLKDATAPEANGFDIAGSPCLPGPLYQSPRQIIPIFHAATAAGIARGALDELISVANAGRQQFRAPVPLRHSEIFQYELGRASADLRAARAFLQAQAAELWRHALAGTLNDEAVFLQATEAAAWIATTCVRIADVCFALGGSSAVYDTSPLQRRLRDLHAVAQHAIVQQRHYASVGKLILERSASSPGAGPGGRT